jgi:hypothetical protein
MSEIQSQIFRNLFSRGLKMGEYHEESQYFIPLFLQFHRDINYPKLLDILNSVPNKYINNLAHMIFFIRNPRGGRGDRLNVKYCYQWLLINHPSIMVQNLEKIPEKGRWDDIYFLFPGALKLTNTEFVQKNYYAKIDNKKMCKIINAQKTVVSFVATKFLQFFNMFTEGKNGYELFAKWLPNEKSALNKKFHIVETLCDELKISLKDYRVIYTVPMRQSAEILETLICKNEWDQINYKSLGALSIKKYNKAFSRHNSKGKKYRTWVDQRPKIYYMFLEHTVNVYLDKILDTDKRREDPLLEADWQTTLKFLLNKTSSESVILTDNHGGMYETCKSIKKNRNYRAISYAIALVIISACRRSTIKYQVPILKNDGDFYMYKLTHSLFDVISKMRLAFTSKPTIDKLIKFMDTNNISNLVYITSEKLEPQKRELGNKTLTIWYIKSQEIKYSNKGGVNYLNGFNDEIYRYFLVYGTFNPGKSIGEILNSAHSK